ncbi:prepilin-type N-terminal cleavage/methylation domain-containing protein [Jejubacter calystegiae]|uniref:Prepilin-type N-terminal cleavage/methylation domain-containing protein n=1 Tax=Jejubacter calystegiae TaxID=2579935 RepID=A0A4P8YEI8_9ENTR|nr:prepilin-type N-terminal cleavage/methylation domain-containing protein [Jejubacter calystegiae]QCT18223.1 prepilin-type N-terminal cleavage/methylation domain-containing protein [Jejubacter calystegiae]
MNRKSMGFTLPELLVVIALTLVLSGMATYSGYSWQQRQRLWHSAQLLRAWLQLVRDDAGAFNRERKLQVLRNGERWCLVSEPTLHCGGGRFSFSVPWEDVRLTSITGEPGFFGLRNTARPGHLTLENGAGSWQVVVSVWGRIRLCRPEEDKCR